MLPFRARVDLRAMAMKGYCAFPQAPVSLEPPHQGKGPYQVLPFQARVDLGAMAMKGYCVFHKAPASLELHNQIV